MADGPTPGTPGRASQSPTVGTYARGAMDMAAKKTAKKTIAKKSPKAKTGAKKTIAKKTK